jgi:hypothetical protein
MQLATAFRINFSTCNFFLLDELKIRTRPKTTGKHLPAEKKRRDVLVRTQLSLCIDHLVAYLLLGELDFILLPQGLTCCPLQWLQCASP